MLSAVAPRDVRSGPGIVRSSVAWREVIVTLNALGVGDLETLTKKLESARAQILAGGQPELCQRLDEARAALERGQFTEYRRLLSTIVSRLGHLKD